jgi:hypothetical protein
MLRTRGWPPAQLHPIAAAGPDQGPHAHASIHPSDILLSPLMQSLPPAAPRDSTHKEYRTRERRACLALSLPHLRPPTTASAHAEEMLLLETDSLEATSCAIREQQLWSALGGRGRGGTESSRVYPQRQA